MARRPTVPNPSEPQGRKPVHLITDRAKRYRANRNRPEGTRCHYCGATGKLDVEHVNGDESDNSPENLALACRSCNTRKGLTLRNAGVGRRTRQYNPAAKGATTLGQWMTAVMAMRGQSDVMTVRQAVDMVRATPAADRSSFAAEIWNRRRERGTDKQVPF